MWTFRPARPDEAAAACAVLRSSIKELCKADHGDDPAILAPWLANKTPDQVEGWINANPMGFLVAVGSDGIVGVGSVSDTGEIGLNYVAPCARFRGVTKGLLRAMEHRAAEAGATVCTLISTKTAHDLYLSYGYMDAGTVVPSYGGTLAMPMRRKII
ncbi:MAG TPA: GNAT family N-acetyltransferase [Acetobacteraceae bacterium]|jgi:GNAT superfamily N-acetyltransferase|nr:GNAT family N-acetyltransferase [Acetobacteraceae bacterium]